MKLEDWLTQRAESRATFARRLDVTPEAVRLWCEGKRLPRRKVMAKIHNETEGQVTAVDFYQAELAL